MLRLLFSREQIGDPWLAIAIGLMGFIMSFGLARAQIIPNTGSRAPIQAVVQAPTPLPPPTPPVQRAAVPGCPV